MERNHSLSVGNDGRIFFDVDAETVDGGGAVGTGRSGRAGTVDGPVDVVAGAAVVAHVEHLERETGLERRLVVSDGAAADGRRFGPRHLRVVADDSAGRPTATQVLDFFTTRGNLIIIQF